MNQECVNLMLSVPLWEVKTKTDYIIHLHILYTHIIPYCRSGGQKRLTADKLSPPKKSFTVHKCITIMLLGDPLKYCTMTRYKFPAHAANPHLVVGIVYSRVGAVG